MGGGGDDVWIGLCAAAAPVRNQGHGHRNIGSRHGEDVAVDGAAGSSVVRPIALGQVVVNQGDVAALAIVGCAVDVGAGGVGLVARARQGGRGGAVSGDVIGQGEAIKGQGALVSDDIGAVAAHVGGVGRAGHGAVTVEVALKGTITMIFAGNGAMVFNVGHNSTDSDAVCDTSTVEIMAHDTTVSPAANHVGSNAEGGMADATLNSSLITPHDTSVIKGIVRHGVDGHIVGHGAILDGALERIACNPADIVFARDTGIGQMDTLDSAVVEIAKEALKGFVSFIIDADAADAVVLPIEGASERGGIGAYGGIIVLGAGAVVPRGGVSVGDVGGLHEGEALAIVAEIDIAGKVVEVGCRGNLVGVVAEAVEVAEGNGANVVVARDGAGVLARARDSEGCGA